MIDISQFSSTESVYVRFSENDPRDMLACRLITERYQGIEAPLMCFSRDGVRTLVVPRTIRPVFFKRKGDDAKQVSTETPSLLPGSSISRGAHDSNSRS